MDLLGQQKARNKPEQAACEAIKTLSSKPLPRLTLGPEQNRQTRPAQHRLKPRSLSLGTLACRQQVESISQRSTQDLGFRVERGTLQPLGILNVQSSLAYKVF